MEERDTYFLLQVRRSTGEVEANGDSESESPTCEEWSTGDSTLSLCAVDQETAIVVHIGTACGGTPTQTIEMRRDDEGLHGAEVRLCLHLATGAATAPYR